MSDCNNCDEDIMNQFPNHACKKCVQELQDRLDDYQEDFKSTINEKCDPEKDDRVHCTCVPHLRQRIKELEVQVENVGICDVCRDASLLKADECVARVHELEAEAKAESEKITELDAIWVRVHEENVRMRALCEKAGIKFIKKEVH
jgi:predicted nuclease with TOPRIM domain